jgi:hypothetical protein
VPLREAQVLYEAKCWDGAYYLAGYAVECALKACIAKTTARFEFPAKDRVISSHTHSFRTLVTVAGLESIRRECYDTDIVFRRHWDVTQA